MKRQDEVVTPAKIRSAAMDLLTGREFSRAELAKKLDKRFDSDPAISGELDRLQQEGLQSDERFVESFVRSQLNKCRGPIRIRADLRQRGISEGQWRDALEGINWHELAEQRRSRKFGEVLPTEPSERARQMRHLAAQGFPESVVRDLF